MTNNSHTTNNQLTSDQEAQRERQILEAQRQQLLEAQRQQQLLEAQRQQQIQEDAAAALALHYEQQNARRTRRGVQRLGDFASARELDEAIEDGQGTSDSPEYYYYTKAGTRRRY